MTSAANPTVTRFVAACPAGELPPGTARAVTVAGRRLALVNHDGIVSAVDGDCPHAGGPLGEGTPGAGCVLACPWHGAVFDVRDGTALRGPARKPVRTYQVRIADGAVQVAVPDDADLDDADLNDADPDDADPAEQGGQDADPAD